MASPTKIRVMISSRCDDPIVLGGVERKLSDLRRKLKVEIESETLFGSQLFDVWINEDAPPAEGDQDSWEYCMEQVEKADIVIVLYNGNSGWAKADGDIGICHGELQTVLSTSPAKARIIKLPVMPIEDSSSPARDERFRKYVNVQNRFRASADDGEEALHECKKALREAVADMVRLGVREARKGNFHTGEALDWSRLSYPQRQEVMTRSARNALLDREGAFEHEDHVFIQLGESPVMICCHAAPAALTVAAAREMIGQPFLHDHLLQPNLESMGVGPVHFILCPRTITEPQAIKFLGFPDATIVTAPFGIYVADSVQKIQLVFIATCRDDTTTRHGIQRALEWLEQSGEDALLCERAAARTRIIEAIARETAA